MVLRWFGADLWHLQEAKASHLSLPSVVEPYNYKQLFITNHLEAQI